MTWQTHQLLAVLHLVACAGICWACICRLNSNICRMHRWARAKYSILLAGFMSSGLQPLLWGTWPEVADAIAAASVLCYLAINVARWRGATHPMRRQDDHEL